MNMGMISKALLAIGAIILIGVLTADYTGLSHHKGLGRVEKRWLAAGVVICLTGFILLRKSKKEI